jgi:large subunit ribosomal protein L22
MAKTQETTISEVRAQAKWVHCSARKARLVLDTIRGRGVPEARTVLAFSTRDVAREIDKVLRSAVANAEANHGFYGDDMVISACYADEGPGMKRWKPRARGRADRIVKGTCHITIKLASLTAPSEVVKPPRPAAPVADEVGKVAPEASTEVTSEPEAAAKTKPAVGEAKLAEQPGKAKPKVPRKATAKPRGKKTDQGEAKPKAATRRKPDSKKEEE